MNYNGRYAGYCNKHNKGPLDAWYDCQKCLETEDKGNWEWLPITKILTKIPAVDAQRWLKWWYKE